VLRHPEQTRRRVAQTASRLRSLTHPETIGPETLLVSECTGRGGWAAAQELEYRPARLGEEFGPRWATYWFRIAATLPERWAGRRVDLLWVSGSEATLWRNGQVVQGLYSGWRASRQVAPVADQAEPGDRIELAVEMACNSWAGDEPTLASGDDPEVVARWRRGDTWREPVLDDAGSAEPANARLERCALAVFDPEAWGMWNDFELLRQLEAEHDGGLDPAWAGELLRGLNDFCNRWDAADRPSWPAARATLTGLLARRGAEPRHRVFALGHAHIDTAWVWPVAETRRKIARSTANQLALIDRYPGYRFAASSAQHYAWLEEDDPDLFSRVVECVAQGSWEPIGGAWIEADCNLPSGESLVRQLLFGQRYFEDRFGRRCDTYWSPDTFGHNGQMPQILRHCGIGRFVTQKLSWNQFTHPRHNSFRWHGIDGSEVLAHLPPAGTYNSELTPAELRASVSAFRDHDGSASSLILFGHGDGGGGPTPEMVEIAERAENLSGLPLVNMARSDEFFSHLEAELIDAPTLTGELYLEYHRGTYTSQARTKRGNRLGEHLLHEAEAASALAWARGASSYPGDELGPLWQTLLRNQFHDILPGTSLTEVHAATEAEHTTLCAAATELRNRHLAALGGSVGSGAPANLSGFPRRDVFEFPDGALAIADCPAYGFGTPNGTEQPVTIERDGGHIVLRNGRLRATLDLGGHLRSLISEPAGREALSDVANVFELYEDRPTAFDAWEVEPYHHETLQRCGGARRSEIVCEDPLRAEVAFVHSIGTNSHVEQRVRLHADSGRLEFHNRIEWGERHRLLKVAFPLMVHAETATYGAQFGVHVRPTHRNTDADLARFEVPGQRFVDLSEHRFGVSILTPSTYGFSVDENEVRISLLRGPTDPDPNADLGEHRLSYAVYPHAGGWQDAGVVAESVHFERGPIWVADAAPGESLAQTDSDDLVLDTIKRSEDGSALVVRLYETHGARGTATVTLRARVREACRANGLEDPGEPLRTVDSRIVVPYSPFELITIRARVDRGPAG
jgi:alpha-mannosidase